VDLCGPREVADGLMAELGKRRKKSCSGGNERTADADCRGGQIDVAWDRGPLGLRNAEPPDRFRIFSHLELFF